MTPAKLLKPRQTISFTLSSADVPRNGIGASGGLNPFAPPQQPQFAQFPQSLTKIVRLPVGEYEVTGPNTGQPGNRFSLTITSSGPNEVLIPEEFMPKPTSPFLAPGYISRSQLIQ
jgi:hypothetical protein